MTPPPVPDSGFSYAPGDVIAGKYALEEMLGEGGMGAVFRARNTAIDMPVAIKLIRADLNRELLSGRLLQEARAAAKLTHPAIVRVFDVGETALGDPFIVMELLEGESLSAIIEREGALSPTRAVQLLLPIADALSAAHAKGFVHRDVKPENVFVVVVEGIVQPKLVDFGIVKLDYRDGEHHLTVAGAVLGSPDYMSPEQARGLEQVDLRSDVWSFSVMLYEAITGVVPFESNNYNALLRMIVESDPLTLTERGFADEALAAIVAQGLRKDPNERFASLGLMGKALAAWLTDRGLTQDVCGVSLESKWLSRQTDPNQAGRISRPSFLENWNEAASGVRNVGRTFASAPTVQAAAAGTPSSLLPVEGPAYHPPSKLWLGGAAAATLLAASLLWLSLSAEDNANRVAHPPERAALAQPTIKPELAPTRSLPIATLSPSPAIAPSPAPSPAASTPPAPSATPPQRATSAPHRVSAPSVAASAARPEPKPADTKPTSDLIAPY